MSGVPLPLKEYDYVVIGSGLAALAFTRKTLVLNPKVRVLCLERGGDDFRSYHERLRISEQTRYPGRSPHSDVNPEERPWQVTELTAASTELQECAGTCSVLGGRSNYWHGWCRQPDIQQMRGFPRFMLEATEEPTFWPDAHDLLNTKTLDQLDDVHYPEMQVALDQRLQQMADTVSGVHSVHPAVFAQGDVQSGCFSRFSVLEGMLALRSTVNEGDERHLDILTDCEVTRMNTASGKPSHVQSLETSKGTMHLSPTAAVILCAGPIPNATLAVHSFPALAERVGSRFGGHFRSHIFAKVPASALLPTESGHDSRKGWGVAARVISGTDELTKLEYHIQLSLFHCPNYEGRYDEIVSQLPRYGTAPVEAQIDGLGDDVLITCTTLGELNSDNECNWLRPTSDAFEDIQIQFMLNADDRHLWDRMDEVAFELVDALVLRKQSVEYWDSSSNVWSHTRPSTGQRRSPILVHEACMTDAGCSPDKASVDEQYRLHGCDNVYVTGAGLFHSAGSWNPALAVCAFALHLANVLGVSKTGVVNQDA